MPYTAYGIRTLGSQLRLLNVADCLGSPTPGLNRLFKPRLSRPLPLRPAGDTRTCRLSLHRKRRRARLVIIEATVPIQTPACARLR